MDANTILSAILTSLAIVIVLFILVIEGIKVFILIKNKIQNSSGNPPTSAANGVSPTTDGLNQVENELKKVLADTIAPQTSALSFVANVVKDLDGQKQTPSTSTSGDQKPAQ